jgi:transcriptional regulator with XRE-family HTH domain
MDNVINNADKIIKEAVEQLLFKSNVTSAQISKQTGIGQNSLGRYRNGESEVDNMTFANMAKLYKYHLKLEEENGVKVVKVEKRKNFEHIIGEEYSREYVGSAHLDFLKEISTEFVNAADFLAVENKKVGSYILENGDFNFYVDIKIDNSIKMSREEAFGRALAVLDKISERHFEKGKPRASVKYIIDYDRKPATVYFRAHKDIMDYARKFDAIDFALLDRINKYIDSLGIEGFTDEPLDPVHLIYTSKESVKLRELIKKGELTK